MPSVLLQGRVSLSTLWYNSFKFLTALRPLPLSTSTMTNGLDIVFRPIVDRSSRLLALTGFTICKHIQAWLVCAAAQGRGKCSSAVRSSIQNIYDMWFQEDVILGILPIYKQAFYLFALLVLLLILVTPQRSTLSCFLQVWLLCQGCKCGRVHEWNPHFYKLTSCEKTQCPFCNSFGGRFCQCRSIAADAKWHSAQTFPLHLLRRCLLIH